MNKNRVQINSEKYSWASITVDLPHGEAIDITSISYDSNTPKTALYGKGNTPVGYSIQNKEQTGSMTIRREELLRWEKYLGKSVGDAAPFPITVSYAQEGGDTTTDELKSCIVTGKTGAGAAQNDTEVTVDIPFLILGGVVTNGIED